MIKENNLAYKSNNNLRDHQRISISLILKKIKFEKKKKILDVGCANGILVAELKKKLKNSNNYYEAIEIDNKIIKNDKKIFDKIYFKKYSEFLKYNKKKYDILILSGTICFFKSPIEILTKSLKLLNKSGSIFIFDRFTEYADVNIIHSFKNSKIKYSNYNATSLYKLNLLKKNRNIKNLRIKKFNLKKQINKNKFNLWNSFTRGKKKNKIIVNNLDIILNFYHVVINKC